MISPKPMVSVQRQLIALLLLSVIVVTGWFELFAMAGQAYVRDCRRAALTTASHEHSHHSVCHASSKTCASRCCADVCTSGPDCRCGTAHQAPRGTGLLLTAQGCHPTDGVLAGLVVPTSVTYRFLPGEQSMPTARFLETELAPTAHAERPVDHRTPPTTPPPRAFSELC